MIDAKPLSPPNRPAPDRRPKRPAPSKPPMSMEPNPPKRDGAAPVPRGDCAPGCENVRFIGAACPGAVAVLGGAPKVRLPRLPKLLPPPMRASAWLT